ncbi:MFS transporter [Pseudoalteromonas tunicata]|uniref:MFS transporter n=1 Tax=Pseudoalteromonas tunicata TaxID=314281 RepID=UPI00273D6650|nr:MFS transporter [Pseudoalteromonas tunicata]MDP4983271.1 MFS transporter [Pseudoalteromonas tunicata]
MKSNFVVVGLVLATFFVISFITNVLGPIFPALIDSFSIGLALAGFFPFAFFVAYGVMSIPAGLLVQHKGEKFVMLVAFILAACGSLLFALMPVFSVAMLALFFIGTAMAMLQVAINPLLRSSGGKQHFAVYSVAAQLLFGSAATLSPLVYQYFVASIADQTALGQQLSVLIPSNMAWLSMYWLFALLCIVMVIIVFYTKISAVERQDDETVAGFSQSLLLFKDPTVLRFFFAIVAYVALEQGIANSIGVFLTQYHQVTDYAASEVVSQFWLLLTVGCLLGILLLKLCDAQHVLMLFSLGALFCLLNAIFTTDPTWSMWAFAGCGFCLSIMWSVLFSLALNSVSHSHGAISGILCTGIVGGAIISPLIGLMANMVGSLQLAMLLLLIPLSYIFSVGIWAKPLVRNHRINLFRLLFSQKTAKPQSFSKS